MTERLAEVLDLDTARRERRVDQAPALTGPQRALLLRMRHARRRLLTRQG